MMNQSTIARLYAAAEALTDQGRYDDAVKIFQQIITAVPDAVAPRAALGHLLQKLGRPRGAMAAFEQAVYRDPRLREKCLDVDTKATEEAQAKTVLDNCRNILALYPAYAQAHYGRAKALLTLGHEDEARRACECALVCNPATPTFYHVLIHTGDARKNASAVSSLRQLLTVENELPVEERVTLHFLLAKAYDDQGNAVDSFAHLKQGNAIKRGLIMYDEAGELGRLSAIATAFPRKRFEALRCTGEKSNLPVFVIGMPRSGTTLVEHILASHPDVFGAGEVTHFLDLIEHGSAAPDFPAGVMQLTSADFTKMGADYLSKITRLAPNAKRIVDKQIFNFLHVGLIHFALPNARILHVTRDPLDTCFSCFGLSFSGSVGFAYDLGELGRYYRAYEELMAHWNDALPPGTILEVRYEDLIADLPSQAQRMIAYCGLEWNARCLDFHKSSRAVVTASLHQVRQPLYKNSVGRSSAYLDQLGPLCAALGLS